MTTKLVKQRGEILRPYNSQSPRATSKIDVFLNTVTREMEQCSNTLVPVKIMADNKSDTGSHLSSSCDLMTLKFKKPAALNNKRRKAVQKHYNKRVDVPAKPKEGN